MVKVVQIYKRLICRFQQHEKQLPIVTSLFLAQRNDFKQFDARNCKLSELCTQMHRFYLADFKFQAQVKAQTQGLGYVQSKGLLDLKRTFNFYPQLERQYLDTGDFQVEHPQSFVHALQLVDGQAEIEDFTLDELATIKSEMISDQSSISFMEDSVLIKDSFETEIL